MKSKLVIGSAFASLGAIVVACTITTERPADSSPPPSPPPPIPAPPAPIPTTTSPATPVLDAGLPTSTDAGTTAADAGTVDAGPSDSGADAAVAPPKKKPNPKSDKKVGTDAGAAAGDGGV